MSSRMRLIRKMMSSSRTSANSSTSSYITSIQRTRPDSAQNSSSEDDESSSNSINVDIRVCFDCNTTKTPLWRTGPMGPKSLCNACGIRQMKARRAMDANNEELLTMNSSRQAPGRNRRRLIEEKRASKLNKGCSRARATMKKKANNARFDEFNLMSSSKISALNRPVFPQDEKEGAILLMALSYDPLV